MNKPVVTTSTPEVKILIISPSNADHDALCGILEDANATIETRCAWMVCPASSVESAAESLAEQEIPIVISECNLFPGTWQTVLEYISLLPDPPLLIVASRLADERLWAEALNLGAWDVLAKPFDAQEVIRVLGSAWRHWQDRADSQRNKTRQQPANDPRSGRRQVEGILPADGELKIPRKTFRPGMAWRAGFRRA